MERKGLLWIFGDSLGVRFFNSFSRKPVCREVLAFCSRSYNWVYPVPYENEALGKVLTDDFDFQPEIILNSLGNVLSYGYMKDPHSLLVLNLGLHYSSNLNFTTFQRFIDDVIIMLRDREKGVRSSARVIWKTSTSIRKENETPPRNNTMWRFFTEPVRTNHLFWSRMVLNHGGFSHRPSSLFISHDEKSTNCIV